METAELSKHGEGSAATAEARPESGKPKRRSPLLLLVVIALATALVVGVTLSHYQAPTPPVTTPSDVATHVAVAHAPVLTPLPLGQAVPGCLDPRSPEDALVLCPGDLDSTWTYDAGLAQPQGASTPFCVSSAAGPAIAWVDVNNGFTNVHEQVASHAAAGESLATVTKASKAGGAALCSNLSPVAGSRVVPLTLISPFGSSGVSAWSVPGDSRVFDVILVAVPGGVIRLDVTEIGNSAAAPPVGVVQRVVNAAVARYLAG